MAHIDSDAQILNLRDFTANLQPLPTSPSISSLRRPPISEERMRSLTDVRRDIVHTIRKVVDVVSKYAGGALPEPARGRVRGFILKLTLVTLFSIQYATMPPNLAGETQ